MQMRETSRAMDKKPWVNNNQICDEDYRGEYIVALHNDSDVVRSIKHGDRIGQIILQQRFDMDFEEVNELDATDRGAGGFGSTGTN